MRRGAYPQHSQQSAFKTVCHIFTWNLTRL